MRKAALLALVLLLLSVLSASTLETDGSFPAWVVSALGKALDENTEGRGDLDFSAAGYEEDEELFSDRTLLSFSLGYGGKTVLVHVLGSGEKELRESLEEEIRNLLYYEDLLLSPQPRLDYITRGMLYSFIPDRHYRNGTRLKAVGKDGKVKGLFEVSGAYEGALTLEPMYLDGAFPGLSLEKAGEWVADVDAGYGFVISKRRFFVQGTLGRTDLLYPFTPVLAVAYQSDEYSSGIYGGIGLKARVRLGKLFPTVGFTLVQEGRIGAEVLVLGGVYAGEAEWNAAFQVYYEHQALPWLSWKAGYERFAGYNYFFAGLGGAF